MCLTNTTSISSSTMNNSSSLSNNNNNNDKENNTKEDDILDANFDYTGDGDDELTLRHENKLEVLSKDESISDSHGWWTGRLIDSELVSFFPANFVANSQTNLRIIDYNDLHIGNTIGVGGFGHVFHGKFGDIDVAIKTAKSLALFCSIQTTTSINNDTSDSVQRTLIESLLREAQLFSNLKHRNIIQLFGVSPSLSTKNLYLVMEYAHGGALNYLLQRRQTGLYPNVFIQYAKQIADGMKYLHEEACEHIIHRDLKCSNILIFEHINDVHNDSDLLQKTLKITDFGLARKQLQSSSMSAAGTYAWMSPECIRNNEFSTKSDVWSFGVLLWECLTGEIPYKGFDQMQVAFGIATNKYSLPIPSTCPEDFTQIMTNCWKIIPNERPTFSNLYEQINRIIEINHMESNEELYQSLQNDWRQEIQDIFNELKEKEQEIRDREQAMQQRSLEQNYQRLQLEKWEQQLHEREMHIVELELKLLMATNNQERIQHQTPKIQKRSGRFMRSLLNGNTNLSSSTTTLIGSPTNFRHLISVCHNHPGTDHNSSISPVSGPISSNSSNKLSNFPYNRSYSSDSTPTTPNMSRLRTLTSIGDLIINKRNNDEFPLNDNVQLSTDEYNSTKTPEKSPRSISQTKSSSEHKSKSCSLTKKRKHEKVNTRNGEAKWYLETSSSINTNNNNDNITISTPIIERSSRKLVSKNSDELSSSSSSLCSTPNDRSLARALFDINSLLTIIGFGRHIPSQINISSTKTPQHQPINEIVLNHPHEQMKLSSISDQSEQTNKFVNIDHYQIQRCCSPMRPNSLILSSLSSQNSSQKIQRMKTSIDNEQLIDDENNNNDKYYSTQSSKLSTPIIHSRDLLSHIKN